MSPRRLPQATRVLTLALLTGSGLARADPAPATPTLTPAVTSLSVEQMTTLMHTYRDGERWASIPFMGTGVVTLATGGLLLSQGQPLQRGAAWPLLGVGALEAVAGGLLFAGGPSQTAKLDHLLAENPQEFATVERHHLYLIRDRYQPVLLIAEAVIVLAGGGLAAGGAAGHNPTVEGVGVGVGAQGLALFLLDWAVLDRAEGYAAALAQFMPEPTAAATP